jgi:hypothetical protein
MCDLVGGVGNSAVLFGWGNVEEPSSLGCWGAGFQPSPWLGLEVEPRIKPGLSSIGIPELW